MLWQSFYHRPIQLRIPNASFNAEQRIVLEFSPLELETPEVLRGLSEGQTFDSARVADVRLVPAGISQIRRRTGEPAKTRRSDRPPLIQEAQNCRRLNKPTQLCVSPNCSRSPTTPFATQEGVS